jgi:hypothetical protein
MTDAALAVCAWCRTLYVTVTTLDLSWVAVPQKGRETVTNKDSPRLAAGRFDYLRLTRET